MPHAPPLRVILWHRAKATQGTWSVTLRLGYADHHLSANLSPVWKLDMHHIWLARQAQCHAPRQESQDPHQRVVHQTWLGCHCAVSCSSSTSLSLLLSFSTSQSKPCSSGPHTILGLAVDAQGRTGDAQLLGQGLAEVVVAVPRLKALAEAHVVCCRLSLAPYPLPLPFSCTARTQSGRTMELRA